jgi:hypothetical protein
MLKLIGILTLSIVGALAIDFYRTQEPSQQAALVNVVMSKFQIRCTPEIELYREKLDDAQ